MLTSHSKSQKTKLIDVISTIESLKRADINRLPLSYIKEKITHIFPEYIHTGIILSPSEGVFYRAIKYENRPNDTKGLSYPSPERTKIGRANFEHKPVFYCSGDPRATFFELGLNEGDLVVLSKWRLTHEVLIFPVGYSPEVFKSLDAGRGCPIIIPQQYKHPNEDRRSNRRINEFLTKMFTQKDSVYYKISAAIADIRLTTQLESGLAYPTIAMRANEENFALTTALVDKYLEIESAKWLRVDKVKDFAYTVTVLASSTSFLDGQIQWREPTIAEQKCLYSSVPPSLR